MNTSPIITLSRQQMLELWRLVRHLEPLRADATIRRSWGVDIDRLGQTDIDRWYEEQLLSRPLSELPLTNLGAEVQPEADSSGVITVRLPDRCLRVASVRLEGWQRPALLTDDPVSELARRQSSPFLRGGSCSPVAVIHSADRRLMLYSLPAGVTPRVAELTAVARPSDPDTFILTRAMLPKPDML